MKKLKFLPVFFVACLFLSGTIGFRADALTAPDIQSRVAIVMDRNTGEVFYSKSANQLVYPASTTKIMTVLLAVEAIEDGRVSMYDSVTAGESMTYDLRDDGSTAGIVVGETMTLENLLYCAMLSSANEACNVIGEYIGGSLPDFIQRMNQRAEELGCTNTHFANTHGLPDTNHYTTANDYSLIVRECCNHDLFMQICSTTHYDVPATNMNGARSLNNSNALISSESIYGSKYLYSRASGIKTGYTSDAGYCLVSTASNNDDINDDEPVIELLACVFGGFSYDEGGSNHYTNFEDTITLYDWVFENFSYQAVLNSFDLVTTVPVRMGADADSVSLSPEGAVSALLPNDFDFSKVKRDYTVYDYEEGYLTAPIESGKILGEVTVSAGDEVFGTVKLVAANGIELSRLQYLRSEIESTLSSRPVRITAIVLLVLLLVYVILVLRYRFLHLRHRIAVHAYEKKLKKQAELEAKEADKGAKDEKKKKKKEPENSTSLTSRSRDSDSTGEAQNMPSISRTRNRLHRTQEPMQPPDMDYFRNEPAASESSGDTQEKKPASDSTAQAERNYFEEFFRQK